MRTVIINEDKQWSFAVVDGTKILTEVGPYKSRNEVLKALEVSKDFIQEFYVKKQVKKYDDRSR